MNHPGNLPATFSDCLTARVEFLNTIQPHGALLITDATDHIVGVSQNIGQWLPEPATTVLGQPWDQWFPDIAPPSGLSQLTDLGLSGVQLRTVHVNGRLATMARHRSGQHTVIEFEPRADHITELEQARGAILASCLGELSRRDTEKAAAQCLMRHIAMVTGFDRVLLLQFLPDWHGHIIDEQLKPGVPGYLNQHFPANDIPANARSLYVRKRQRLIADAWADPVPLVTHQAEPFDLSFAELRAVHPAHVQYMRNMGTATSFSVSLVVDGQLWGLVVCHNLKPRAVSFAQRQLCEHLTNATALQMAGVKRITLLEARHVHLMVRTHLKQEFLTHGFTDLTLQNQLDRLRLVFNAAGAWAHYLDHDFFSGTVPEANDRARLGAWLEDFHRDKPVCVVNQIPEPLAGFPGLVSRASGILSVRFTSRSFLVLLRPEQSETISWAGHPAEGKPADGAGGLSPRTSFSTWEQLTAGQARPWESHEVESAVELRLLMRELFDYLSLEQKSQTDALTGLANRDLLYRRIEQLRPGPDAGRTAVLMIDLDNFKPVNDTHGHAAGDDLLIQVGQRIRGVLRDTDLLARLGGDEFAIVVPGVRQTNDLETLGARLLDVLHKPFSIEGQSVSISASVGAALFPDHGQEPETLLHHADMAMYDVKRRGRDGFAVYQDIGESPVGQAGQG